jgi:outer membrane protein assembly factor BamA
MKPIIIFLLLITPTLVFAQYDPIGQVGRSQDFLNSQEMLKQQIHTPKVIRLRKVVIEGFTLKSTKELERFLESYRNKVVGDSDIAEVVEGVRGFYIQAGYESLIDISYKIKKRILIITVSLKA